ncbi:aspartate/glutamate racemase family protein [Nonomuraea rosea]|uniref:Aspartate/glutamate racemase family protein n=1 Tax=Nonomuraea rosea TaxID=638574 RepID=A0ABP6ZLR1_9ACTN
MSTPRIGMVLPSLNTIAEDDFRTFCPVPYHVHRIRLRKEAGRVTTESLMRAYLEATEEAELAADMGPDAIVFNCTGASVAFGGDCDARLARRMTERLGIPATNTMVAIKAALAALRAENILHICPFTGEFSQIERESLIASGFTVKSTVSLGFLDAKAAALMEPGQIAESVRGRIDDSIGAVLLSCANVRAFEAADALESAIGRPVVTSNQAVLWAVLRAAGWTGEISGAGGLFHADR